jgi:uncharacterized RDD family membrane protein YckC
MQNLAKKVDPSELEETKPGTQGPHLRVVNPAEVQNLTEDDQSQGLATGNQRLVAILLDGIFSTALTKLVFVLLERMMPSGPKGPSHGALIILQYAIYFCYWIFPLYGEGQTLGKKIMGLKVVSDHGDGPLGFGQVLGRELVGRTISAILLCYGYVGAFNRKDRKTFHDRMFSTHVVSLKEKN